MPSLWERITSPLQPQPWADRDTGELRRAKVPVDKLFLEEKLDSPLLGGREAISKELVFDHGMYSREGGKGDLYWNTIMPRSGKLANVLVFFHGYGCHSGWHTQDIACTCAKMNNTGVITFDMPGFGRSDGLFMHITDWFEFVDAAHEFVEKFAMPKKQEWEKTHNQTLMIFGMGESMGGGVLMSLGMKHKGLFDGIILSAPMLYVSDKIRPPAPVTFILKNFLVPLLPTWPITPVKDIATECFTDPALVDNDRKNPLGPAFGAPRLQTALCMGFQAPDWMAENLKTFDEPVLILHGAIDAVTDPDLSKKLHDTCNSSDKTLILVENSKHADFLHGGKMVLPTVEKAYADIGEWMKKRSEQRKV